MPAEWRGLNTAKISLAAAAILLRVRVDDFSPTTSTRHADFEIAMYPGREIKNGEENLFELPVPSEPTDRAFLSVLAIDPLEAFALRIAFVQRSFVEVDVVEAAHHALDSLMVTKLGEMPVEAHA